MSLRYKVSLLIIFVFLFYGAVEFSIRHYIILPSFLSLERKEAINDINRVTKAIQREIHNLNALCHDWAAWNDTYEFIKNRNPEYIESNLPLSTFTINELNLMYFINKKGNVVWHEARDLKTEMKIEIDALEPTFISNNHTLLSFEHGDKTLSDISLSGLFITEKGPLLISSRPILTSENEGPVEGTVILGRILNKPVIEILKKQTQVDFSITMIEKGINLVQQGIIEQLSLHSPYLLETKSDDLLEIFTTIKDITGKPALLIKANVQREIFMKGNSASNYALLVILISGLTVLFVILLFFKGMILTPLQFLINQILSVGKTYNFSSRIPENRNDEFGVLYKEFNQMLGQLSGMKKQLQEQSYNTGMAEMASGVLHNIRNAMNPAVSRLQLLKDDITQTPIEQLKIAQEELLNTNLNIDRKTKLLRFIKLTNDNMLESIKDHELKIDEILNRFHQIELILLDHQKWAYGNQQIAAVDLKEVLEEAVRTVKVDQNEHINFVLNTPFSNDNTIYGNVVILSQVFNNILINAAAAIQRQKRHDGRISIGIESEEINDNIQIHIRIKDNGDGIKKEALKRIFERGYSTKHINSSGIGLHWCANTIIAMQGTIYAESPGLEKGSCFHIIFPNNKNIVK